MRKFIVSLLLIACIILSTICPAFAAQTTSTEGTTITYFDDGSYLIKTIISDTVTPRATTFTKSGNIVASYYDGDDTLLWEYTLYGEFEIVSGVSAVCTSATYTQTIYADRWSFSDGLATASGDTAYGAGTFKKKVLFVTTSTVDVDLNIVCDVYGNLS